jgi:hypothetical protein
MEESMSFDKSRARQVRYSRLALTKGSKAMSDQLTGDLETAASQDAEQPKPARLYGRRALVLGAAAAGAGAAVSLLAGADPAGATPTYVELGVSNSASGTTSVTASAGDGLQGITTQTGQNGVEGEDTSSGGGQGLRGVSKYGTGVYGTITGDTTGKSAVYGVDDSSGGNETTGQVAGYGVQGTSEGGIGVYGVAAGASGLLESVFDIYTAVIGDTNGPSGIAVVGLAKSSNSGSSSFAGVYGVNTDYSGVSFGAGAGVVGDSSTQPGVAGVSASASGVSGVANGSSGITPPSTQNGVMGDTNAGYGVLGMSSNSDGIHGITNANGGYSGVTGADESSGNEGHGLYGSSVNGSGVYAYGVNGVLGITETAGGLGVEGVDESSGGASGVYGYSVYGTGVVGYSFEGVGVYATGPVALEVDGVAAFSRSGTATVAGTSSTSKSSIEVTGVSLSSTSQVLATPQTHVSGVGVAAVVPDVSAGSFTIYLTKAVKVSLRIAWFIVDQPADAGPRQPPARPRVRRPTVMPAPRPAPAASPALGSPRSVRR